MHPAHKHLAEKLQDGDERAQRAGNDKVADGGANVQPAALVPDHPEEIQGQHVADRHDDHEEARRRDAEPAVEDAQVGGDDRKGDHEFEDEECPLRKGAEDGDEPVDAVEGEGRDGGNVAR